MSAVAPSGEESPAVCDRLGRPLRDLRISVTDRCNLRCTYCMPKEHYGEAYRFLPREELLTFEELGRVARAAVGLGVRKLRITGGEPLLRKGLSELIAMLRVIPGLEDLALTTNGLLLPALAAPLRAAGLDRITVSLDSLDEASFGRMNGMGESVSRVLEGIRAAEAAGFERLKINAVVQRGVNDDGVLALAEHFRGTSHVLRFIEYMDVGTLNHWELREVVPSRELVAAISARYPLLPAERHYPGEVAQRYTYADGQGEVGFISSVTQPFCGDCTRLRLSAEGRLYTCLFGAHGTDLRAPLRVGANAAAIEALLRGLWHEREDRYSEIRSAATLVPGKVEMYHIGG